MPIVINLDVMLAKRKMRSIELAKKIGLTTVNLSILKQARQKPFGWKHLLLFAAS